MFARIVSGFLLSVALGFAQQPSDLMGDYAGVLGSLHITLHLTAGRGGTLAGTVDSPDQMQLGMPLSDVRTDGQTLSFTVPMVRGTWIGFVSGNATSLSGTWNQGTPMPLNLARVAAAGTPSAPAGAGEVKWDDYTFKFDPSGRMAQVFEGGKIVGTILVMNGDQRVIPLPGPDADKLKKSFEDYKVFAARSHAASGSASPAGSAPSGATPPAPPGAAATVAAISFDEANHTITVPRPDGVTVTFVGEDVRIAGFHRVSYIVRHQKGTPGRFFERTLGHPNSAGGSLSGGGMEFLLDGGGIIYDSGMGTSSDMQVNSPVLKAKQLSKVAVDAVADVRQIPGHENFTPPGYNTLKEISQYRLRSDGSR